MRLPSIKQYIDSIDSPFGLFKTMGEVEGKRDTYGKLWFRAGNSSVIFKVFSAGETLLLKCHIKAVQNIKKKYEYISKLSTTCEYINPIRLLEGELFVYDYNNCGEFFDVVLSPWSEGVPLSTKIEWAVQNSDSDMLADLATSFDRMALSVLRQEWAHGDLKPDNIIVDDSGGLHLIDYDAFFIPELSGAKTSEIGTQPYQHPLRGTNMYDKHIDDYSLAMISVCLHALAKDMTLYQKYHKADNILFDACDILSGNCEAFNEVTNMWCACGDSNMYQLAQLLKSETPYLEHLEYMIPNIIAVKYLPQNINLTPVSVGGLWGYVNEKKETVITPIYDKALSFSNGVAAVSLAGTCFFIDSMQNVVINCGEYSDIKPFSHGLAAVSRGGLWGYIDMCKTEIIKPVFQMASSFRENFAVVRYNNHYGYINMSGEWQIEPIYAYATNFKNQRAEVEKDGKILCIDINNRVI